MATSTKRPVRAKRRSLAQTPVVGRVPGETKAQAKKRINEHGRAIMREQMKRRQKRLRSK